MAGFPPDTLSFLRDLAADPTRTFFDANRDRYHAHWRDPAAAFVEAVAPGLARLAPGLRAEPRVHGSILHPRQDVRFGSDRALYRDHVGLVFWEGERADAPSVLFLRVHPDHVTVGVGARWLSPDRLRAYREAVLDADRGGALVEAVEQVRGAGWPLHGATLARGPRGVQVDDPERAELLRHTALWAEADLPRSRGARDRPVHRLVPATVGAAAAAAPLADGRAGGGVTAAPRGVGPGRRVTPRGDSAPRSQVGQMGVTTPARWGLPPPSPEPRLRSANCQSSPSRRVAYSTVAGSRTGSLNSTSTS